jgi:hypothetical protein
VSGDRKYKVPVLDPLEIQELKIADAQPRQVGLSLVMKNAKVFGMKNSELEVTRSVHSPASTSLYVCMYCRP